MVGDRRSTFGALAAVTIVGAVLRVSYLNEPMRWDEAIFSLRSSDWSYLTIASRYDDVGNHILHTLAMSASQSLFGPAPWSVRLPSLLAGVALIPVTFLSAASLFSRPIALVAAGLVAGSPLLTFYSVNSRGYILQCTLLVFLVWLLRRLAEAPSLRLVTGAGIVGALALYTLPTTLLVLPALYVAVAAPAIWGKDNQSPRATFRALIQAAFLTGSLAFLLYLPVFLVTGLEQLATNRFTEAQPATQLWGRFGSAIRETADRWTWHLPLAVQFISAAVVGIGVLGMSRLRQAAPVAVVLLIITITLATSLLLQRIPPVRAYTFLMPFFLMLLAVGIHALVEFVLTRRRGFISLVAVLLATSGMIWTWSNGWIGSTDETGRIVGAEAAMQAIALAAETGDRVAPPFPHFRYYARLHDLPVRFLSGTPFGPDELEGVDRIYVMVREHRETLSEQLDQRLDRQTGALDAFDEPELFQEFPDLQVFVMHRRQLTR